MNGSDVLALILIAVLPAAGFLVLTQGLDRWGRRHDPMKRSHLDYFTPGAARRKGDSPDE